MRARIYKPSKSAMQSGRAGSRQWVFEFELTGRQRHDPLMGWLGAGDTAGQVRLRFDSQAEATAFAERHRIAYTIKQPATRQIRPKAYADNFAPHRREPWSH